jgi:hypothetical protein
MDRNDGGDATWTAVREFLEEMGIVRRPTDTDVSDFRYLMQRHGNLRTVVPTNRSGFSAHAVVFDTALEFERKMMLTQMLRARGVQGVPQIKDKYFVDMSSETKGYTYVPIVPGPPSAPPLPTFAVRNAQGKLRRGVSDRAMRGARAMV